MKSQIDGICATLDEKIHEREAELEQIRQAVAVAETAYEKAQQEFTTQATAINKEVRDLRTAFDILQGLAVD